MGVDCATLQKKLLVAPVTGLVAADDVVDIVVVDDVVADVVVADAVVDAAVVVVAFCYVGETAAAVVGDGAYSTIAVEGAAGSALTLPPVPLTTNKHMFYHPKTRNCAASLNC